MAVFRNVSNDPRLVFTGVPRQTVEVDGELHVREDQAFLFARSPALWDPVDDEARSAVEIAAAPKGRVSIMPAARRRRRKAQPTADTAEDTTDSDDKEQDQ